MELYTFLETCLKINNIDQNTPIGQGILTIKKFDKTTPISLSLP